MIPRCRKKKLFLILRSSKFFGFFDFPRFFLKEAKKCRNPHRGGRNFFRKEKIFPVFFTGDHSGKIARKFFFSARASPRVHLLYIYIYMYIYIYIYIRLLRSRPCTFSNGGSAAEHKPSYGCSAAGHARLATAAPPPNMLLCFSRLRKKKSFFMILYIHM